jgi:MFS family permease
LDKSTLATSVFVPAVFTVAAEFNVGREVAVLPLSLYTLGLGIGPLVAAPLSEIYGRRIMYWSSIPLLLAFTAGAGAAQNIETLIICRFLAGVLGSGPIAIGAGSISDLWDTQKDGGPASLMFVLGPFLGPGLGKFHYDCAVDDMLTYARSLDWCLYYP